MNDSWLTWLLVVEIAFPFILLSIVLIAILIRGKTRYKDAMRELIINVKDNEPLQNEATQRFLQEKLGLDDASAGKLSSEIIKERKFFFRTFVASILNKDVENLATLDEELSRITEKYHALTPNIAGAPEEAAIETSGDASALQSELESKQAEIEQLKQEVKGLKQEVHITLTTLNNIFAEYSSMFGEDVARRDMSVEQILTAMESFSGPKSDEVSATPDPVDVSPQKDTDTVDDLELEEPNDDDDTSALDKMPLEDVSEEEPSWEDAFDESGEEMTKQPD